MLYMLVPKPAISSTDASVGNDRLRLAIVDMTEVMVLAGPIVVTAAAPVELGILAPVSFGSSAVPFQVFIAAEFGHFGTIYTLVWWRVPILLRRDECERRVIIRRCWG
jgi:hypothetical protein